MKMNRYLRLLLLCLTSTLGIQQYCQAEVVDLYFVGGQSNANASLRDGVIAGMLDNPQFTNAQVVHQNHNGNPLREWLTLSGDQPVKGVNYLNDFFNPDGTGALQAAISSLIAEGKTPRLRGLFWFQGETDTTQQWHVDPYKARFQAMLSLIASEAGLDEPLPFVIAQVDADETKLNNPEYWQRYNELRQIQLEIANESPVGAAVDTRLWPRVIPNDHVHLTHDQRLEVGAAMVAEMAVILPEPSTLVLTGCLGFAVMGRRRYQSHS